MAARKTPAKTTTKPTRAKKDETPAEDPTPAEATPAPQPEASALGFAEQAAQIAADARALADNTRHELAALTERCGDLTRVDPGDAAALADHVRRIPMAVDDANRALAALAATGAALTAAANR
ncbi:hypothetical protein [Actinomadura madurae]|uniref:hypothetical protein n=1 Tax=Actinomadura madurae TaxID=1993 RepID=UPI0020D20175|nr:hypothetical protein [Actinomadura madurae]MCQ0012000.1 hypothetical protein [Actinomadura madurae]